MAKPIQLLDTSFYILEGDTDISRHCVRQERLDWDHTFLTRPEILECLKPGNVVFDIGAYIGDHTRLFLNLGCHVYAFEPRDDAFYCLQQNCPDAVCIPKAVGDPNIKYVLAPETDGNLGGRQLIASNVGHTPVDLDYYIETVSKCNFLKIDVEGFEPFVLDSGKGFIHTHRPPLYMEINKPALKLNGFTTDDVLDRVRELRYRFVVIQPERVGTDLPWDVFCSGERNVL